MFHICAQCSALFVPSNKRGRRSRFCGDSCQNRFYYERRKARPDWSPRTAARTMRCAACGGDMWRAPSSRPEGIATCRACQRRAWGLPPEMSVNAAKAAGLLGSPKRDLVVACRRCDRPLAAPSRVRRYCSDECSRKARNARGSGKASPTKRGYGYAHQLLRAELLPQAYGKLCHLCDQVMGEGDDLHLDHTEDRSGYRGMTHAACNVLDGARRGGQQTRQARLERGWRPGQDPSTRRRPAPRAA